MIVKIAIAGWSCASVGAIVMIIRQIFASDPSKMPLVVQREKTVLSRLGAFMILLSQQLRGIVWRWCKRASLIVGSEIAAKPAPITWLWTCSGNFFGYRLGDALFTYKGRQAGQFGEGDEIYNSAGQYIGEIQTFNRLVTNVSKRTWHREPFLSHVGASFRRTADLASIQIRPGFEDFSPI